jgi:hypothetical protein
MSLLPSIPENELPGNRARRRGARCLLLALIATPIIVLLFLNLDPFWVRIAPLEGVAFLLAATLFGVILAVTPVIAAAGWLLALWYGVESVFMLRTRHTPVVDILIVGAGLVAWFSPVLGFLGKAAQSLFTGGVRFAHPPRSYLLAEDPIAFWQSIGFLFIAAGLFAWFAWYYWKGKLRRKADE